MRLPCPWHFPHFLLEQKRREHVQEALGKGTTLNDEVAESEQRGVLFLRRMSGIPPLFGLSYTEREVVILHQRMSMLSNAHFYGNLRCVLQITVSLSCAFL